MCADVAKFARCKSHSFAGFRDQLHGDRVQNSSNVSSDFEQSEHACGVEVVPYSVFSRAGKRGHYETCGVIVIKPDEAITEPDVAS